MVKLYPEGIAQARIKIKRSPKSSFLSYRNVLPKDKKHSVRMHTPKQRKMSLCDASAAQNTRKRVFFLVVIEQVCFLLFLLKG